MLGKACGRTVTFWRVLRQLLIVATIWGGVVPTVWANATRADWLPKPSSCLQGWAVPGGRDAIVQGWITAANSRTPTDGDWVAQGAALDRAEVRIWLARRTSPPDAPAAAALVLWPAACAPPEAKVSGSFAFLPAGPTPPDPGTLARLTAAAAAKDDGEFFQALTPSVDPHAALAERHKQELAALATRDQQTIAWTFAVLALGYALVLLARWRGVRFRVRVHYRRHHLLPVALQLAIYVYWALYFPAVRDRATWILTQVVIAYLLDGLLLLWREREFHLGLSPLPVVGSLNLFLWTPSGSAWVAILALVCAFGSKALIRRGGVHIMNPSAFGAAAVGVLTLIPGLTVPYIDISHQFGLPPNMTELLMLLILLPQTLLPIVPASLGALAAMTLLLRLGVFGGSAGFLAGVDPLWAPGFIAITLLITDPMTLPKRPDARVLTGALFGLLVFAMSALATSNGHSDYFAKVWPVPFINLLAPRLEAWGARLEQRPRTGWFVRALSPRHNRIHMLVFFGFCALELHHDNRKSGNLLTLEIHGWLDGGRANEQHIRDDQARCAAHPAWCTPFSFAQEPELPPPTFPQAAAMHD